MVKVNWVVKLPFIYLPILLLLFILLYSSLYLPNQNDPGEGQSGEQQQQSFLSRTQFNETFFWSFLEAKNLGPTKTKRLEWTNEKSDKICRVTIAIILCNDESKSQGKQSNINIGRSFDRQILQLSVMLKSIAFSQKFDSTEGENDCVNVLVLSDDKDNFQRLKNNIHEEKWSPEFVHLLNFIHVQVSYPPGLGFMKNLFRPCATLRLFLPELLPTHDIVIYVDTDIIFFRNLVHLWNEFEAFDSKTVAAMSECLYHYGTEKNTVSKSGQIPYYGKTGLNAGIILMNLTRMREIKWTNKIRTVTSDFKNAIKLADQDILNIYFHYHPDEMHVLSCDWNFRSFQCQPGSFCQDLTLTNGISALHGNALSFTRQSPEPLFLSVFSVYQKLNLTQYPDPSLVDTLFNSLRSHLQIMRERRLKRPKFMTNCFRYGAFDLLILTRLDKIRKKSIHPVFI